MAQINTEPYTFEDRLGRSFTIFDEDHTVTDILNMLVNDVGFDEVEEVLKLMIEDAKESGTYEDNR